MPKTKVKKVRTPSRLSKSQASSRKKRPALEPHLNSRYTRKKAELIYSYPIRMVNYLKSQSTKGKLKKVRSAILPTKAKRR